eukprot:GHVQ01020723.1.p1 GENE.GHVQ01020723.1~~GHVQ01020723.1.p1  ORF type:complete len:797 (+),score=137.78 GHVQ01020723.1:43-2391(+)
MTPVKEIKGLLDEAALTDLFVSNGIKLQHLNTIWRHLFRPTSSLAGLLTPPLGDSETNAQLSDSSQLLFDNTHARVQPSSSSASILASSSSPTLSAASSSSLVELSESQRSGAIVSLSSPYAASEEPLNKVSGGHTSNDSLRMRDIIPGLPFKLYKLFEEHNFALCSSKLVSVMTSTDKSTTKLLIRLQSGRHVEAVIMRYGSVELASFPRHLKSQSRKRSTGGSWSTTDNSNKSKISIIKNSMEKNNTSGSNNRNSSVDSDNESGSKSCNGKEMTGEEIPTYKSGSRGTLCVSSQVGCAMGCTFCATGTMGLLQNLSVAEILEQVFLANCFLQATTNASGDLSTTPATCGTKPTSDSMASASYASHSKTFKHTGTIKTPTPHPPGSIRNVVFMGMGEPLDNYKSVVAAIRALTDVRRFGLSGHRISISTVGVAPRIKQLSRDCPKISLALSLHAPNQELRQRIVPSSAAWSLDKILDACMHFLDVKNNAGRRESKSCVRRQGLFVEYVLLKGVNDSDETALELGTLLANCVHRSQKPRPSIPKSSSAAPFVYNKDSKIHGHNHDSIPRDTNDEPSIPQTPPILLNVIPYNPTKVAANYLPPTQEGIDRFVDIVRSCGVVVTVRQELGQDINSACGQLAIASSCGAAADAVSHEVEDLHTASCSNHTTATVNGSSTTSTTTCLIKQQTTYVKAASCVVSPTQHVTSSTVPGGTATKAGGVQNGSSEAEGEKVVFGGEERSVWQCVFRRWGDIGSARGPVVMFVVCLGIGMLTAKLYRGGGRM